MANSPDQFLKENKYTLIIISILVIGYLIYRRGKKDSEIQFQPLPDGGAGIPVGWSPRPTSAVLKDAMNPSGIEWMIDIDGTEEEQITGAVTGLSRDQATAVYNDYLIYTGRDLIEDFNSELSGTDLIVALAPFSHIGSGGNRFARALVNKGRGFIN